MQLAFTWLCLPYVACAAGLLAMATIAALVRGDRVVRLGVMGSALTALPWALCTALALCATEPALATRLMRLGSGPVALIGPNLLLVLLAVSGQLERHRWLVRGAGIAGAVLLGLCWGTPWVVPGVRLLSSGAYYAVAGPLTDVHISQLALWLAVGAVLARRAGERARRVSVRGMLAMLALCAVGTGDLAVIHGVGAFPVAWVPGLVACGIAIYLELRTDLLRPQGIDSAVALELGGFALTTALVAAVALALSGAGHVAIALAGALAWAVVTGGVWALARRRPAVRVAGERALEAFVARLADVDDEARVAERLAALWAQIDVRAGGVWRTEARALVDVRSGERWPIDEEVAAWLAQQAQPFAADELQTIRLGALRAPLESFVAAHGAGLIVPLVDAAGLVGLVEATPAQPLRDAQRALVAESARAAARALTYVRLARIAAEEGATAREVEVADAMRSSASASRDDELGRWVVGAEYRSAPHTTGAGWSAALLPDGRLALLVTEADAHGVPAALATAALSGAFAATTIGATFKLDEVLAALRASGAAMLRGQGPIAAFLAVLDAQARTATWACAGHPGALLVEPAADPVRAIPVGGGGARIGAAIAVATRGQVPLTAGSLFVVASSGARGADFAARAAALAPTASRLAPALVETSQAIEDDLLAVVVRMRVE